MLVKIFDTSPFVEGIDAISRVKLFGSNAIGSSEIVKYGDLTEIFGGGITGGSGRFALLPSFGGGHSLIEQNADGSQIIHPTSDPCPIAEMLANVARTTDIMNHCLMLSRKLRLDARDPDAADGLWKRSFCDFSQPRRPNGTTLDFVTDGVFDCREELMIIDGYATVIEEKFFKTADAPGVQKLYFAPTRSRLWSRVVVPAPESRIFITSELGCVLANSGECFWWFQNCGDLASLDFAPVHGACFLVLETPEDAQKNQNSFAEALSFKTAALRSGASISAAVIRLEGGYDLPECRGRGYFNPQQEELDDEAFLRRCDDYRLSIDPILRGNPYEVKLGTCNEAPMELLPFLFTERQLTLVQEQPGASSIRPALLPLLSGRQSLEGCPATPISTLLFLRNGRIHRQRKQIQGKEWTRLKVYEDTALLAPGVNTPDEMKKLLDEVRPQLMLLELSGYSAAKENALLAAVDVCLENGVGVGIFTEDGDVPTALTEIVDRKLIIGSVSETVFIVKEKIESGEVIRKFDFSHRQVTFEDSNEKELATAMQWQ